MEERWNMPIGMNGDFLLLASVLRVLDVRMLVK
jgi:hypothetical protein